MIRNEFSHKSKWYNPNIFQEGEKEQFITMDSSLVKPVNNDFWLYSPEIQAQFFFGLTD